MAITGMVDALHAAHRRVRRGGLVIDARPDQSRPPRVVARGRVRGRLVQTGDAWRRDEASDAAIERSVRSRLFRRIGERGVVWHSSTYADLAELDAYLADSARYAGFSRGTRAALSRFRDGPIAMRRAVKFEILERI